MSVTAGCPLIDSVYVSDASEPTPPFTECISGQLLQSHGLTNMDWRKAQLADSTLSFIVSCLEASLHAPLKRNLDPAFDGRYLKVVLNGQDLLQLVLPPAFRENIFTALHDDLGHQEETGPCH